MDGSIFISYRRETDSAFAGRLYDRLEHSFGRERVFIDVDSIAPGEDFVAVLESRVVACDVLLALIGRGWLTATDAAGQRRLDNPEDFVRIEIGAALAQGKRVIPVLSDDVTMPRAEDLPNEIKPLARRNATRLTHDRFKDDAERLIRALERALAVAEAARQAEEAERQQSERERQRAEEEARRRAEAEATRKAEEERQRAVAEAEAKRQAEEKGRRAEEEAKRQRAERERQRAEEEAHQRVEAEAKSQAEKKDRRRTGEETKRQSMGERPQSRRARWITAAALIVAGILSVISYNYLSFTAEAQRTFRDCDECPEMVALPGGTFLMGSPEGEEGRWDSEGPQHEVTVEPFAIGKYEVTFEEWDACVAAGGCNGYRPPDQDWDRGRRPVINVSWRDAQAYVAWLAEATGKPYRLPSEAEWEYAARAGTTTRYAFGDDITENDANFGRNVGKTTEVGAYPANAWGLHDMHGNVWEWVEDVWYDSYQGAPTDGSAWTDGEGKNSSRYRVYRGGSWGDDPRNLRSDNRLWDYPESRNSGLGFRVARTLD